MSVRYVMKSCTHRKKWLRILSVSSRKGRIHESWSEVILYVKKTTCCNLNAPSGKLEAPRLHEAWCIASILTFGSLHGRFCTIYFMRVPTSRNFWTSHSSHLVSITPYVSRELKDCHIVCPNRMMKVVFTWTFSLILFTGLALVAGRRKFSETQLGISEMQHSACDCIIAIAYAYFPAGSIIGMITSSLHNKTRLQSRWDSYNLIASAVMIEARWNIVLMDGSKIVGETEVRQADAQYT